MKDPHVHAKKTLLPGFAHQAIRVLIADAAGVAPDLPKTVGTGCGLRRPFASASTCLACRERLRGECLFWADAAAHAIGIPAQGGSPTAEDLRAEERTYRALAARFEVTR
jgi:hypothetical protein